MDSSMPSIIVIILPVIFYLYATRPLGRNIPGNSGYIFISSMGPFSYTPMTWFVG